MFCGAKSSLREHLKKVKSHQYIKIAILAYLSLKKRIRKTVHLSTSNISHSKFNGFICLQLQSYDALGLLEITKKELQELKVNIHVCSAAFFFPLLYDKFFRFFN